MIDQFTRPLGPFAVLYEQRTPEAPAKKRRSGWQRVLAKRAKEGTAKTATERVLRKNPYSDVGRATDSDKTGRIQGRRLTQRSQ